MFLWILPSVSLSVRSYAFCATCKAWKQIAEEQWTPKQLQRNRLSGTKLHCAMCRKAGNRECAACGICKNRSDYSKQDLNDKQKKEKSGASYMLVCTPCKAKEAALISKLDMLDARLCPRSCGTQLFRHADKCKTKLRVRFTRDELEFLTFRATNVRKYFVTDVAYYMRLGVIS